MFAVQTKENGSVKWEYRQEAQFNMRIMVQRDLRGSMIYQAWPAYLGIYRDGETASIDADETRCHWHI